VKYEPKTTPYAHQREALLYRDAWQQPEFAWLMEMGTGKSKVALDNLGILAERGLVNGALIVAPKTVCRNWTEREIPTHLPDRLRARVILWRPPSDATIAWKHALQYMHQRIDGIAVLVMNIEALSHKAGVTAASNFLRARRALFIVDESTTIKERSAKRTRNVLAIAALAKYRRIMSGMPVTRDPLDLWSQFEFLRPGILGDKSFLSFRARYAHVRRRVLASGRQFDEVLGFHDLDTLAGIVGQFSYRCTKADCLDLPPKVYTRREVGMDEGQRKVYDALKEDFFATTESGEVSVPIILTKLLRLHQVTCGWVPLDSGGVEALSSLRLDALLEVLREAAGKVIIWASYRHDLVRIAALVENEFGKDSVRLLHGDVSAADRARYVVEFQDPDSPVRFIAGTPQTGGVGITLTAASTVVYYSNSWNLEARAQSEDRAHRIGQRSAVTYVDLVVPDTIDETILKALREKRHLAALASTSRPKDLGQWL
jgi:SNF2 family DNA or RNA helicase